MTDQLIPMLVNVSVATVWTTPNAPRPIDDGALQNPVDISTWVSSMDLALKQQLNTDNMVQTQALYGSRVFISEEDGEWAKVLIPHQSSRKDERGYPGWVPKRQLVSVPDQGWKEGGLVAVVRHQANLYQSRLEKMMELSFLTQLPVWETDDEWITVRTPAGGIGYLRREDVWLREGCPEHGELSGERIVELGKAYLGLPYLWGGLSSYGYDCSGFAYSMHKAVGITIPRDAVDQAEHGEKVDLHLLKPGDLLFFAYEEGKGRVHHVGIYMGDGHMIHSPDPRSSIEIVTLQGYRLEKELCVARRYWQ